jgi:hypothetical protein
MKRSRIYFSLGIILLQVGACMIHYGLGLMMAGAFLLFCSYMEFEENHKDEEE